MAAEQRNRDLHLYQDSSRSDSARPPSRPADLTDRSLVHAEPDHVKVRVENLGRYYDPVDLVENNFYGWYIKNRVIVTLETGVVGVKSVTAHLVAIIDPNKAYIIKPYLPFSKIALGRVSDQTWESPEVIIQSVGKNIKTLIGAPSFDPGFIDDLPGVEIDKIDVVYRDGKTVTVVVHKPLIPIISTLAGFLPGQQGIIL